MDVLYFYGYTFIFGGSVVEIEILSLRYGMGVWIIKLYTVYLGILKLVTSGLTKRRLYSRLCTHLELASDRKREIITWKLKIY